MKTAVKTCRNCTKCNWKRQDDGSVKLVCDDSFRAVNGFSKCEGWEGK